MKYTYREIVFKSIGAFKIDSKIEQNCVLELLANGIPSILKLSLRVVLQGNNWRMFSKWGLIINKIPKFK